MTIGANIAVVAAGAILAFATHVHFTGFSLVAVGAILMAVGVVSLVMQLAGLARQRRMTVEEAVIDRPVLVRPDSQDPGATWTNSQMEAGRWR
jgi:hypothetical protein